MTPDHWPKHPLSELCDLVNGNGFKASEWATSGLPIIRIQNLNGSREFNYYDGEVQQKWLVEPGDLLFAWAGVKGVSFGPRIWNGPRGVLNQHIFRVVPKNGVTKEYLHAVMGLVTSRIEGKSHGFKANFVHVQRGDVLDQTVAVPVLPIQNEITNILSTWDRAIELTERLITSKRQRKAALRQHLLTGKVRLPGFGGEWPYKAFSQVFRLVVGRTPSRANSEYWDRDRTTGNRWVSISDMKTRFITDTAEYVSDAGLKLFGARILAVGTILMSFKLSIGKLSILKVPAVTNEAICALVPKDETEIDRTFVFHAVHTIPLLNEADVAVKGQTLNQEKLQRLEIPVPQLAEQQAIATVLDTADEEIALLTRKLDALRRQKKGLMQQLLTGKVRVRLEEPPGR